MSAITIFGLGELGGLCERSARAAEPVELRIVTEPAGATVTLEPLGLPGPPRSIPAAPAGQAPSEIRLRLPTGAYRVRAQLRGFRPYEQIFPLQRPRRLLLTLTPAVARLEVSTPGTDGSARGGELRVDGRPAGVVPVPVEVTAGTHQIEVRKAGYQPFLEPIQIEAGESRTLWVTLKQALRTGTLLVQAPAEAPAELRIFVDGRDRGPAPLLLDNLAEGDHEVELRAPVSPDGPPRRQVVRVEAGKQAKVSF